MLCTWTTGISSSCTLQEKWVFSYFSSFTSEREGFWRAGFYFSLCLRAKSSMNIIFHSASFACLSTLAISLVGYSNITNKINMSKFRSTNKFICDTNFAWQIIHSPCFCKGFNFLWIQSKFILNLMPQSYFSFPVSLE